jgi:hypothetical protein
VYRVWIHIEEYSNYKRSISSAISDLQRAPKMIPNIAKLTNVSFLCQHIK